MEDTELTQYEELLVDWCRVLNLGAEIASATISLLRTEPQQDAMIQWFLDNHKREIDYRDVLDAAEEISETVE